MGVSPMGLRSLQDLLSSIPQNPYQDEGLPQNEKDLFLSQLGNMRNSQYKASAPPSDREGGLIAGLGQLMQSGATGLTKGYDAAAGAIGAIPETIEGTMGGLDTLLRGHEVSRPQLPDAPIGPRPEPEAPLMTPEPQVDLTTPPVEPERQFSGQYGGITEPLGEMPGPHVEPPPDMQSRLAGVNSQEKARQVALIVEGLTRAGAEFGNVPTLQQLMSGQGRGPTDQSNADRLAKLRQLSGEREDQSIKDAKNPLTDMVNREYKQNFDTPEQAQQYLQGLKAKADIGNVESTSAARTGKAQLDVAEAEFTAEQAKRFAQGDYSAAPQKIKDEILKEVNTWTKDNKNISDALSQASKIETFLDSGNSVGARMVITQMVLLGGETGRLTEGDIGRSARRMGFEGYKDFVKNFIVSNLNQEQRDEILEIVDRARTHAKRSLKKTSTTTANRLMKFYPQFKQNDLVEMMLGQEEKASEKTILMVDPDEENKPQNVPESEHQTWLDAGWQDG